MNYRSLPVCKLAFQRAKAMRSFRSYLKTCRWIRMRLQLLRFPLAICFNRRYMRFKRPTSGANLSFPLSWSMSTPFRNGSSNKLTTTASQLSSLKIFCINLSQFVHVRLAVFLSIQHGGNRDTSYLFGRPSRDIGLLSSPHERFNTNFSSASWTWSITAVVMLSTARSPAGPWLLLPVQSGSFSSSRA
jgi:hypothetical protein